MMCTGILVLLLKRSVSLLSSVVARSFILLRDGEVSPSLVQDQHQRLWCHEYQQI